MYQGAGREMVSRSDTAMDRRTVLVGESMAGLLRTVMVRRLDIRVTNINSGISSPYTGSLTQRYSYK